MLFNVVTLKPAVEVDDVEMAIAEMCAVVKDTYSDDGFIAGQVFKYAGFVSTEGSVTDDYEAPEHIAIITYWKSFDQHESSHRDEAFKKKFDNLVKFCDASRELGYELLWQGEA